MEAIKVLNFTGHSHINFLISKVDQDFVTFKKSGNCECFGFHISIVDSEILNPKKGT
jgi:hypothetical protein